MTTPDTAAALQQRRRRLLGDDTPTFYDRPVHLVRGEGVWVWDSDGNRYLDCYNNVPHVGHCHPRVVEAVAKQAATLNTHTRYLHEGIVDYVERLTVTFHESLNAAVLTCTGSEANDVAMRMAQCVTGHSGYIATDRTYHGNTIAVSALSGRYPGSASEIEVAHVPAPDSLREGVNGVADAAAFTRACEHAVARLDESGHGIAALVVCPFQANEGFPCLPVGFFDGAAAAVRKAGGIVIADEVQIGFGRLGSHLWGHQRAALTPEIATLGKPMGNGFPVGAVVVQRDILSDYQRVYRYFNTFGGNPVACAAANAVLDVLEDEALMENAEDTGHYTRQCLREIASDHEAIADVRGSGLFMGAEFVRGPELQPHGERVARIVNAMRERGVLLNRLGIDYSTLKIRPPMPFGRAEADLLAATLSDVLRDV